VIKPENIIRIKAEDAWLSVFSIKVCAVLSAKKVFKISGVGLPAQKLAIS
jgi:hypothetical protein